MTHDLDVRVARVFNNGPPMRTDDGRLMLTFVRQALTGEDLTVHGDGSQTRSFCYVSDLIDGLRQLMESDLQTPVTIGNPDERSIEDLARIVLEVTDSDSGLTDEPRPPQDPSVRRPDLTKIDLLLPATAIEQILRLPFDCFGLHTGGGVLLSILIGVVTVGAGAVALLVW